MNIAHIRELGDHPDTQIIPLFNNDKLDDLLGKISRKYALDAELLRADFKGKRQEVFSTYVKKRTGSHRLFLIGMGDESGSYESRGMRKFFHNHRPQMGASATVVLNYVPTRYHAAMAQLLVSGSLTGSYDLGLYKTDKAQKSGLRLNILSSKNLDDDLKRAINLAETQVRVMDMVNAPSNKMTPSALGEWALESGNNFGYKVSVWDKEAITAEQLNTLLAVNQGSDLPPAFIIAEYHGPNADQTVGFVGKGVTFDTGGISIKGSANMHYMKSDMGGAATVLGTIELAARLQLPLNIIAIVPATENTVDARSIKPGDVVASYSGKTIEIIDTDAEGRLILADALAYMTRHYKPDYLVDYATLTGSVIATLGYHAAGLFTANSELEKRFSEAGKKAGEKVWSLPLWDDYSEDLESDVADVKNYSGRPLAGAITAAKFLEVFTGNHPAWAHLDIAGTAFGDTEFGKQKNATAFGVSLNLAFLEGLL